jgi:hypothetical protein
VFVQLIASRIQRGSTFYIYTSILIPPPGIALGQVAQAGVAENGLSVTAGVTRQVSRVLGHSGNFLVGVT